MPIYTYTCENGHQFDRFLPLKDYKKPQTCDCGEEGKRKIMPTMVNCDMAPWDSYVSPASGKLITSYKERRKDMVENDCVDYEPSLTRHMTERMNKEDEKLEKAMDETVEKTVESWDNRKREKLANELQSGADCVYERK